tara:strand:- start:2401 stop:3396 length:996 start_codon:yes stop_codon:yes gene_type:complete
MKNIIFKFEADDGTYAGTGHFFRILKLYNEIKKEHKTNIRYYFIFKNLSRSIAIVKKYIRKNIIIDNNDIISKLDFLNSDDIIINDTPKKIENNFINFCNKKKINNLIFIDHDYIPGNKKYIFFNGIFYFKKVLKKRENIYQGYKYIILNNSLSSFKNKKKGGLNVLVTTGGTDNKNIIYKIYKCIKNFKNIKFYFIIGPGFKKNNTIFKIRDRNIFLIKNKTNLNKFYNKTDITITSGGISMFESVSNNNITLVTELYNNQKYSIKKLLNLNLIHKIGKNDIIYKNKLIKLLEEFNRRKGINKLNNFNQNIIDNKGLLRIKKILFKIIKN